MYNCHSKKNCERQLRLIFQYLYKFETTQFYRTRKQYHCNIDFDMASPRCPRLHVDSKNTVKQMWHVTCLIDNTREDSIDELHARIVLTKL